MQGCARTWHRLISDGTWRSLVAHLLWEQGVASSNLAVPISRDSHNHADNRRLTRLAGAAARRQLCLFCVYETRTRAHSAATRRPASYPSTRRPGRGLAPQSIRLLDVKGTRIAIRADDIVAFYSEDEAGAITVRRTTEKRMRVDRDRNGNVAGISPA